MMPMNLGALSQGSQLNRMLDTLGLPDKVGDMMGAALDAKLGNAAGMMRNLFDGFSKLTTGQMDFGALTGMPAFGSLPSPQSMLGQLGPLMGAFTNPAMAGGMSMAGGALGMAGSLLGGGGGGGMVPGMGQLAGGPLGMAGNFLNRMMQGLGGAVPGSPHSQGGGVTGADVDARSGKASPLETGGDDIRSIVSNPNLSIEEKMALALMKMAEKQEAKLEAQLDKMSRPQGQGETGGGLGGGLKGAFSGGQGGGNAVTGNAGGRQESEQIGAQKLQMIQQKMSRLLDTLSNIMKSFHQTSSTAIRNIN
ncbi:MAG: hypothetical protein AAGN66_01100 [Acidobacteriota bacterium]